VKVVLVFVDTDINTCAAMCDAREGHPTIKGKGEGARVIDILLERFQPPVSVENGFVYEELVVISVITMTEEERADAAEGIIQICDKKVYQDKY
jgi:hypothetical protein